MINQLRAEKQRILAAYKPKKRRRCHWEDDTPLIKLVNLSQYDDYKMLITDWQKHSIEIIQPTKTSQFTFLLDRKWHVIRALCLVLSRQIPVFKVSRLQLCEYLETHTNLGKARSIYRALYRMY